MQIDDVKKLLIQSFEEVGLLPDIAEDGDTDLRESIADSLQYISAVLQIENNFDITMDDNLLIYENLASFNAFAHSIYELVVEKDSAMMSTAENT